MGYIDMHCDTLMKLLFDHPDRMDLYETTDTAIDLVGMRKGGQSAQFFACFMPTEEIWQEAGVKPLSDEDYINALHSALLQNVQAHPDMIAMAYSRADLERNEQAGKMSAFFTLEDGRAVDSRLENLDRFHEMGVRAIGLTWNGINCLGYPNSREEKIMMHGLTDFGKDAVRYMQEIGILVDVSHLSEGGFYDVASVCTRPFIASHSDCRALSPHPRNLTDDQIRVLADHGGVSGLNFCAAFLNEDITCRDSTAALLARHARHMADVGGIGVVALGSDLDGTSGNLEIDRSEKMGLLFDALKREGFSEAEIEQIRSGNIRRVMHDAMH